MMRSLLEMVGTYPSPGFTTVVVQLSDQRAQAGFEGTE
jgi:hypothetical protein